MSKVAVIFGYGPGISDAVLSRFSSSKGYKVAVTARNAERLQSCPRVTNGVSRVCVTAVFF